MQEYKQKKDEFKAELNAMIRKFNEDTGCLISDIDIVVNNLKVLGVPIELCYAEIELMTNIDK